MVIIFLTRICLTLTCLILFSLPAHAELAEKVIEQKKAVVTISVEDKEKKQIASARGFILDQRGIIATNCFIIAKWLKQPQNMLRVKTESGLLFPVRELISSRCENNLALIKTDAEEPAFVAVDREYKLEQGDRVFLLSEKTTDATRVSDITLKEVITKGRLYRISHPFAPELSGSPLFNSKGKVVGAAVVLPGGGKPYSAAVSLAPITPPPPALFSTITLWPIALPSGSAIVRATMSVVPPGANGTTSLTILFGYPCANAEPAAAAATVSAIH